MAGRRRTWKFDLVDFFLSSRLQHDINMILHHWRAHCAMRSRYVPFLCKGLTIVTPLLFSGLALTLLLSLVLSKLPLCTMHIVRQRWPCFVRISSCVTSAWPYSLVCRRPVWPPHPQVAQQLTIRSLILLWQHASYDESSASPIHARVPLLHFQMRR